VNESKPLRYEVQGSQIYLAGYLVYPQTVCDLLNQGDALLAEKESLSQELFCLRALSAEEGA
jgi:hypothetical protein